MSDCDICMTADYDGFCEEYEQETAVAPVEFKCCECNGLVPVGGSYELTHGIWDGNPYKCRTCLLCAEIAKAFYCNGRMHESLWEDMGENVFERLTMNSKCFQQLSAAAKTFVLEKWNEWLRCQ